MSFNEVEEVDLGDITPVELPYLIGGKKYLLLEPTVEQANNYRGWVMNKVDFKEGKPNSVSPDMADVEYRLVAQQLVTADERQAVDVEAIKKWPSRITKKLFAKLREIGELDEEPDSPK